VETRKIAGGVRLILLLAPLLGLLFSSQTVIARDPNYSLRTFWTGADAKGGAFYRPFGIAVAPDGSVYVTDFRKRVVHLNPDGHYLGGFGAAGNRLGQFSNPVGVAVAPDGSIYVSDYDQDRIQKLGRDGRFELQFGSHGNGPGQFDAPTGIGLDMRGNVYVADFYNNRIEEFLPTGRFLRAFGKPGRMASDELHYPTDVAIQVDGDLLVADAYNYEVKWFNPQGKGVAERGYRLLASWPRPAGGSEGFNVPSGIAVGPQGFVHIADSGNHRIVMLSPDHGFVTDWKLPDADSKILSPTNVAVSPDGKTVYATDFARNRVIVLTVNMSGTAS
jgi:DNA-binding beta-propeller fold protein YncE